MIDRQSQPITSSSKEENEHLLQQYWRTRNPRLRDRIIRLHAPLVRSLAVRFAGRGEALEDLIQVGTVGLIHAIDGFDPERGVPFSSYAIPTIVGTIRNYFRDTGWHLTVPRRLQEQRRHVTQASERLTQQFGRPPTIIEIAAEIGATEDETLQAIEAGSASMIGSLESPVPGEGEGAEPTPISETVGGLDPNLEAVENRLGLEEAIASLARRERQVLDLYFFHNLSQAEVGRRLGLSQMQVSRLQRRALSRLKKLLTEVSAGESGAQDPGSPATTRTRGSE